MGSDVKDRYLIVSSRESKGSGTTRLCEMFPEKRRNVSGLKTPIQKLTPLALSIGFQVLPAAYWASATDRRALQSQIVLDNSVDRSHRYVDNLPL